MLFEFQYFFIFFYPKNIKSQSNPYDSSAVAIYSMSSERIASICGTATTDLSLAIRDKIGSNHPSVHSI